MELHNGYSTSANVMAQPGLSNSEDSSQEEGPCVVSPQWIGTDHQGNELQVFPDLQPKLVQYHLHCPALNWQWKANYPPLLPQDHQQPWNATEESWEHTYRLALRASYLLIVKMNLFRIVTEKLTTRMTSHMVDMDARCFISAELTNTTLTDSLVNLIPDLLTMLSFWNLLWLSLHWNLERCCNLTLETYWSSSILPLNSKRNFHRSLVPIVFFIIAFLKIGEIGWRDRCN